MKINEIIDTDCVKKSLGVCVDMTWFGFDFSFWFTVRGRSSVW